MLLVIDVGNTNISFGVFDGPVLLHHVRCESARARTSDEYAVLVRSMLALRGVDLGGIDSAIVASVVPTLTDTMVGLVRIAFGREALVVGPGIKTGMAILYENPREVGADRIVNAVAGYEWARGAVIVVDFGTATTFDVISARGEYVGGVIAPGLGISADALFARAAKLARVDVKRPARVIGTNTIAHLQSGLFYGYIGLVDGILERMLAEIEAGNPNGGAAAPKVIATGGLAHMLHEDSKYITAIDDMLTLDGLRLLYERNRSSRSRGAPPAAATS
jgi:type III pantothenate kinase